MNQLPSQSDFFKKYSVNQEAFEDSEIEWSSLIDIYNHYTSLENDITAAGQGIVNKIIISNNVHSVRFRIKDAEHLIEKIIRKRLEKRERVININNYLVEITDLIGIRAIHLYKEHWKPIHEAVHEMYELCEKPVAYYREGDNADHLKQFTDSDLEIKKHKDGYRSIHYTVKTKPAKQEYIAEIQVRTIFEEGWSEIDHDIRYPYDVGNTLYMGISSILNRLAGNADEIGSFITAMKLSIEEYKQEINRLQAVIEETSMDKEEKKRVQTEITSVSPFSSILARNFLPTQSIIAQHLLGLENTSTQLARAIQTINPGGSLALSAQALKNASAPLAQMSPTIESLRRAGLIRD